MRRSFAVLLLLAGCAAPDGEGWVTETWWIEPSSQASATGLLTLQQFEPRWARRERRRHHRCVALFEIALSPTAPCDGCDVAWQVQADLADTDCADPLPLAPPVALGIGDIGRDLRDAPPYADVEQGTWVRYDDGPWLAHGWAFRGSPDAPETSTPAWNGEHAVTGWPAWARKIDTP